VSGPDLIATVTELVRERDALRDRTDRLERQRAEVARLMYRKGYYAGHAAGKRGTERASNPERHARGENRDLMAVG
jgi:hypothetical protein